MRCSMLRVAGWMTERTSLPYLPTYTTACKPRRSQVCAWRWGWREGRGERWPVDLLLLLFLLLLLLLYLLFLLGGGGH